MEGAREVFLSQGFDAASMGEIACEAQVSKGTLYVYFDSKERLFEAMALAHYRKLDAAMPSFFEMLGENATCYLQTSPLTRRRVSFSLMLAILRALPTRGEGSSSRHAHSRISLARSVSGIPST